MMEILGFKVGAWEIFGFVGNICFGSRFILQWIASERAKRSIVPVTFWYLSLAGSVVLLVYFIHLRSIVGVLAYLPNTIPYSRNLMLIHREKKAQSKFLGEPVMADQVLSTGETNKDYSTGSGKPASDSDE
jgi:lipid-A-disaccharide synthase-like uncharacterized protein